MRAGVALGSNLGDRLRNLQQARDRIRELNKVEAPFLQSAVYETEPVGCAPGDPPFLNAVVELDFDRATTELLARLQKIEHELGRARQPARNAPRTIDLDLLYFGKSGEVELHSSALTLPHPRMHARRFVLQPLADIRPDLQLAGQTATVRELLARLSRADSITCVAKNW